jgi:hypothetical protein
MVVVAVKHFEKLALEYVNLRKVSDMSISSLSSFLKKVIALQKWGMSGFDLLSCSLQ